VPEQINYANEKLSANIVKTGIVLYVVVFELLIS